MAIYGCSISSSYLDWLPVVGLLILITFFIIALVYMLSQLFRRPDWSVWAKGELWQAFISCILVGAIIGFASTICIISESIAGGDPFFIADSYLHKLVWTEMVPAIDNLFRASFQAQVRSALTIGILSCSEGVCFQPNAGAATLSYNFETMAALVTPFTASLLLQKLILQFVKEIAFTLILPIGLILRVFPLTRDAGAFLMAAAIAFYAVFPLTYVFNSVIMMHVMQDPVIATWCTDSLCMPLNVIGQLLPQAVFLPALNLVITVSFMQSISRVLSKGYGDEIE